MEAKIWGWDGVMSRGLPLPAEGDLLEVQYQSASYQGRSQWVIQTFRVLSEEERAKAMAQFTPTERIDRGYYRQRLDDLIDQVPPERVCGLILREIFDQPASAKLSIRLRPPATTIKITPAAYSNTRSTSPVWPSPWPTLYATPRRRD